MADQPEAARRQLRSLRQTRDTVLNLLLIEAGLLIVDDPAAPSGCKLVKQAVAPPNTGMTPELALATVVIRHLRNLR